jgi:hypothetical protein
LSLAFYFLFQTCTASSQTLPKDSQERKQLIAMGYEIDSETEENNWTIARLGTSSIGFSKSKEKLTIIRSFVIQKELNAHQELEVYRQVNRVNTDLAYQTVISDNSVTFVLYDFGDYSPKTFAKLVRYAEQANSVFDSHPELFNLLSK